MIVLVLKKWKQKWNDFQRDFLVFESDQVQKNDSNQIEQSRASNEWLGLQVQL